MARIPVVVAPGARRGEVAGRLGDAWRLRVAAPPERGRANAAVCELMAARLAVPVTAVRILKGRGARRKLVEIDGLSEAQVNHRLAGGS